MRNFGIPRPNAVQEATNELAVAQRSYDDAKARKDATDKAFEAAEKRLRKAELALTIAWRAA